MPDALLIHEEAAGHNVQPQDAAHLPQLCVAPFQAIIDVEVEHAHGDQDNEEGTRFSKS